MNALFVIFSAILAHLIPAELLLAAYAFLGPLHYLTEISWLHNRQYFLGFPKSYVVSLYIGCAVSLIFPVLQVPYLAFALAFAAANALRGKASQQITIFALLTTILLVSAYHPKTEASTWVVLALLLPTLLHVCAFTLLFIARGYQRNKDRDSLATLGLSAISLLSFFVLPRMGMIPLWPEWTQKNIPQFLQIAQGISSLFEVKGSSNFFRSMLKLLAFSYTFHYLNWFLKVKQPGWLRISRWQWKLSLSLYVVFAGLYIYDYQIGLKALLYLSFLHVILEFPLNAITLRDFTGGLLLKGAVAEDKKSAQKLPNVKAS